MWLPPAGAPAFVERGTNEEAAGLFSTKSGTRDPHGRTFRVRKRALVWKEKAEGQLLQNSDDLEKFVRRGHWNFVLLEMLFVAGDDIIRLDFFGRIELEVVFKIR